MHMKTHCFLVRRFTFLKVAWRHAQVCFLPAFALCGSDCSITLGDHQPGSQPAMRFINTGITLLNGSADIFSVVNCPILWQRCRSNSDSHLQQCVKKEQDLWPGEERLWVTFMQPKRPNQLALRSETLLSKNMLKLPSREGVQLTLLQVHSESPQDNAHWTA